MTSSIAADVSVESGSARTRAPRQSIALATVLFADAVVHLYWASGGVWMTGFVLAMIGVLHLVWTVSLWPFATRAELVERAIAGWPDGDLPPPSFFVPVTIAVAVGLLPGGYFVAVEGGALTSGLPDPLVTVGTWAVAAVLHYAA